jgi:gentisate 1,2-dioxygenase
MMWMDCLDTPFVYYMQASWFEPGDGRPQAVTRLPSVDKYRGGMVRPIGDHVPSSAPLAVYRWDASLAALRGLRESRPPDAVEGWAVEYINPSSGGSACETIGAWLQELPPDFRGLAHRHVNSAVYHVKEGSGWSVIGGVRFDWSKGDYFCVPSWTWHEHASAGGAVLFSTNDIPIYEKVGLQRLETHAEGGGHQEVESTFEPAEPTFEPAEPVAGGVPAGD